MTREEIMNSVALKRGFCADCDLPITVFDNPYFYERLQTFDILKKDCISKFENFCDELQDFPNEQEYLKYYNEVKRSMIQSIKNNSDYKDFASASCGCLLCVAQNDLYVKKNDGLSFISIDMKEANFSAMRYYSQGIFDYCETWEEYVSQFTYSKHISDSKYIRQVILEACNSKKQIQYEHCLMNILCNHIMKELPGIEIYSLDSDKIIISVPDKGCGFSLKMLREVIASCPYSVGELVRTGCFQLKDIGYGWMKIFCENDELNKNLPRVEFKWVNSDIYPQIIKHYYDMPITDSDLVFCADGQLTKFMKKIENPFA